MILNALVERLKRRSKGDFKGWHFEASLILQAVSWYLRYPLSVSQSSAKTRQCEAACPLGGPRFIGHAMRQPRKWGFRRPLGRLMSQRGQV